MTPRLADVRTQAHFLGHRAETGLLQFKLKLDTLTSRRNSKPELLTIIGTGLRTESQITQTCAKAL